MCGIIGILTADRREHVVPMLIDGLVALQHRGQDAAGIVTWDGRKFALRKANGLVSDVFKQHHVNRLQGSLGVGHVRYPTAGTASSSEAQPFYTNSPYGICLAHNGNLTNSAKLELDMMRDNHRHVNTDSDSELLLNVLGDELQSRRTGTSLAPDTVFDAVAAVHRRCSGSYAAVAAIHGFGLIAFRDPFGIRPLVVGRRASGLGGKASDYVVASESVAVDILGFQLLRDVAPGECVCMTLDGGFRSRQCADGAQLSPCIFEFVYFARPDSIMDGISVYEARLQMGDRLADTILRQWPDHDIEVVMPVPDTSRTSALQLSYRLGLPFREGFIKNRYIARTFIMPGQARRAKSVRKKLNPIRWELAGKNVLLVDDSVVRGTTSSKIVALAREAGARRVYFCSAAPAIRFPNVYGIDMPSPDELVAHGRSEDEVGAFIGADRFFYQTLAGLVDAVQSCRPAVPRFDTSCFDGEYVTGVSRDFILENAMRRRDAVAAPPGVDAASGAVAADVPLRSSASEGACSDIDLTYSRGPGTPVPADEALPPGRGAVAGGELAGGADAAGLSRPGDDDGDELSIHNEA